MNEAFLPTDRPFRSIVLRALSLVLFLSGLYLPSASIEAQVTERAALLGANDSLARRDANRRPDIVSMGLEVYVSSGGGTFLSEYRKLGGTIESFDPSLVPYLMLRLGVGEDLRVIGYGTYLSNGFVDLYNARSLGADSMASGSALAAVVEDFSARAIPILAGIEYSPVQSQFTSYVGAAAGISINTVEWLTTTRELTQGGYYRPGINVRETDVSPALKFYTGIDLRFDRYSWQDNPFRGIFLEASYVYVPVRRDYFAALIRGTEGSVMLPTTTSATLQLGGFTFTVGLNLQFLRR
jgi:hypothetical protein